MNRKDNTMYNLLENLKALRPLLPKGYTKIIAKEYAPSRFVPTLSNGRQFLSYNPYCLQYFV